MDENRRVAPDKARKRMEKEIKKGQKELVKASSKEDLPATDPLPAKQRKAMGSLAEATVDAMRAKKKKRDSKQSKRTTPGEVSGRDAAPAHAHTEDEKWKHTVDLQRRLAGKVLDKKLQKRNQAEHKKRAKR